MFNQFGCLKDQSNDKCLTCNIDGDVDPTKEYICFCPNSTTRVYPTMRSTGLNYLMKLVLSSHKNDIEDRIKTFLRSNKGKQQLDKTTSTGYTPLILSVINAKGASSENIFKILVDNGCDVNVKDCLGNTALSYAVGNNYSSLVKMLISVGCYVNTQECGNSVTHYARSKNVRDLLKDYIKSNEYITKYGKEHKASKIK